MFLCVCLHYKSEVVHFAISSSWSVSSLSKGRWSKQSPLAVGKRCTCRGVCLLCYPILKWGSAFWNPITLLRVTEKERPDKDMSECMRERDTA